MVAMQSRGNEKALKDKRFNHRLVLSLTFPMILSNISTPLLGLVDTAVLGHLDSAQFLAAVALGGVIFSFIFWGFGFLRMGTTGLTAQAFGKNDKRENNAVLARALSLALAISCLLLLMHKSIASLSFNLLQSSAIVEQFALQYFEIRIMSAPATLCSYVLMGWFLGRQNVKLPLLVVLTTNIINICLDLLFVYHLKMQVDGVALATVIAEYIGLAVGLIAALRIVQKNKSSWYWCDLVNISRFKSMLLINSNIFVRTWCVIFAFAFFTAQASKMGDVILAANTVLLNFQTFMAYALDGFAHAVEALVGKAVGAKNRLMLKQAILTAGLWAFVIAILFLLIYFYFGRAIIDVLTNLEQVRSVAYEYLPWLIIMPLVSFICYLLDGVFIGAMLTKQMRNTMLFSLFCVFLPVWYYSQNMGNTGLWMAMTLFMLARSLAMLIVIKNKVLLENS
jgi:MATE family multidrug resistance protein